MLYVESTVCGCMKAVYNTAQDPWQQQVRPDALHTLSTMLSSALLCH
jgi:hypothetical protein